MKVVVSMRVEDRVGEQRTMVQTMQSGYWHYSNLPTPSGEVRVATSVQLKAEEGEHRPLIEVLRDAMQHGQDNPGHGGNCACMDKYIRELRAQVRDATTFPEGTPWDQKADGRWRVTYLINVLGRSL